MGRLPLSILLVASCHQVFGQVPYPDCYVQDEEWTDGTHLVQVPQKIFAPGDPGVPVTITGTADAEFVSATQVRLTPGFHAGAFTGGGRFRAHIDESLGSPEDVIVIAPDPATHISNGVLHVNKWEKLEVGFKLPQDYQDAIDRFFANYYTNGTDQDATPGNVDPAHDLNPYADDSLQLVMTLTGPSGQRVKWGFFMREAEWEDGTDTALLIEHTSSPLYPYHIRFRFAPEEEGLWQFALSVKAPHTNTLADDPLPPLLYTGYGFVCEPPLADNRGYLKVHPANRRILQFDDGTPFIGLGTNMADERNSFWNDAQSGKYHQRDFNVMRQTMEDLSSVGGNFLRMFMLRSIFAPEWTNIGVYDHFRTPPICQGNTLVYTGSCQYQSWAFDQMLDHARDNGIYVQLCIDPYPPVTSYQTFLWGAHPYVIHFLEPRRDPVSGRYDLKEFFYEDGDPANTDSGVFYYWKRKYKYIMSRWGYSVNIAAIEPFNEIDQMLTYQTKDLTVTPQDPQYDICPQNQLIWPEDPDLPATISQWFTDIAEYVRDPVDLNDPVASPLGEGRKLFLASYARSDPWAPEAGTYYLPFTNPAVDLMSAHKYTWPVTSEQGQPDWRMKDAFDHVQAFRDHFPSNNAPLGERKPFTQGEMNHSTRITGSAWGDEIEKIFHNYDVSFHNEIWASAFSGKFAAGTTWLWERVFWWPDALPVPPPDNQNQFQATFFNTIGATNNLDIGGQDPVPVINRRLHHHFRPLADLLAHPSFVAYDFFNGNYTAHKVFDESNANEIEAYYLKNADNDLAIGWVHNRNAWVMNSYYLTSASQYQNFLGCDPPSGQSIALTGFEPEADYYVTWFPTWMNSTVHPPGMQVTSNATGIITLDLTDQFGGTYSNYLDTLRADYAFIITPEPFVKSLPLPPMAEEPPMENGWDFIMYPNPARDELFLRLPDDTPKDITLHDLAGRQIHVRSSVTGVVVHLPVGQLAKGVYYVRVSDGSNSTTKKLVIY
jgi:hypothetical protein